MNLPGVTITCGQCSCIIQQPGRYCPKCGAMLSSGTAVPSAPYGGSGGSASNQSLVYPRNPPLSPYVCLVNLLLPGVAQMIHGQAGKGIVWVILWFVSWSTLGILTIPVIIASVVDAYRVGRALKSGRAIGQWEWNPK